VIGRIGFAALALFAGSGLVSCASARMSDVETDNLFRAGRFVDAQKRLEEGLKEQGESGNDILLYQLDLALAHRYQGNFAESNKYFAAADKLAEEMDYRSISGEVATLLTSDNIKFYRAEDFEWVLMSLYLSMNYAEMGKTEDAIVEARRVNRKLLLLTQDGKRKYKQNAFARYLSAVLYETEQNWNDAYIDYKEAHALQPNFPGIGLDLYRLAHLQRDSEAKKKWEIEFNLTAEQKEKALESLPKHKQAQVVILYENGLSPVKKPHPSFYQIPKFFPRYNPVSVARVELNGQRIGVTQTMNDIESTAIENLDEKYAGIVAKKVAGIVAKEVVSKQVENVTKSPELALITKLAFYLSDQADVRSWNLLPRDLQIMKLTLPPGEATIKIIPEGSESKSKEVKVQLQENKTVFIHHRYIP